MLEFQIPKNTHEEVDDHRGKFVVEPLDRGFGYTFGNSLRRVLLSSLEGSAISSVKIEGVSHEFSSVKGVREDVTDLVLNFKRVVCKLHGEDDEIRVQLVKEGPAVVTAADIDVPAELEILNPEQEIANLEDGALLEVTLTIRRGRGYAGADENRSADNTIGVIPIDSIFSPVSRVSYDVEAARVGQRTDYDKLVFDISTNGSVNPKDALSEAADILVRSLSIFATIDAASLLPDLLPQVEVQEESSAKGMENILIEELDLGVRSYNCLKRVGVETIGDLVAKSEAELAAIPNFGKKSIEEVIESLERNGLALRGSELG
ncbi:MAG: DNA-directed RNA polymerase subunit alpha [Thermoleophilia bacterium]|nr:DNA-directed RNA polymerase subunit alpha [Thermoleophilia bacterium]